jgi:hypothetical protein
MTISDLQAMSAWIHANFWNEDAENNAITPSEVQTQFSQMTQNPPTADDVRSDTCFEHFFLMGVAAAADQINITVTDNPPVHQ